MSKTPIPYSVLVEAAKPCGQEVSDSQSQHCPNCEAQAAEIEKLEELAERLRSRIALHSGQLKGMEDRFEKRLAAKDKAKRLANSRADVAFKAAQALLSSIDPEALEEKAEQ
jgi:hypothetical protein